MAMYDTLDPKYTQSRSFVTNACSDELKFRKESRPNFQDHLEIHTSIKLEEKKQAIENARLDRKRLQWEKRKRKLEKNNDKGPKDEDEVEESLPDDDQSDTSEELNEKDSAAVFILEKKVLTLRKSYLAHGPVSTFAKTKTALALRFKLGWRSKVVTPVMSWLYIGSFECAQNIPLLLKLGITHILNLSYEVIPILSN